MMRHKFFRTDTGIKHLDTFDQYLTVTCMDKGDSITDTGPSFSSQHEWELMARIRVTFRANRAQFESAQRTAMQYLLHLLYDDVLREIPSLRMAISDGDRRAAYQACDRIESAMRDLDIVTVGTKEGA